MVNHLHIHNKAKENKDTGFGSNTENTGGRFLNKDGTMNMRREGVNIFKRFSVYQAALTMPLWKFISVILIFYAVINLVFTGIYIGIGIQELDGLKTDGVWNNFKQVFYFSTQTFTTVGYGRVSPVGDAANIVSSLEALTGFMSFAIATGLIYGRFARPKPHLLFSNEAVIGPFHHHKALMFQMASYKDKHTLTDVEIVINLGMYTTEEGKQPSYKFFRLDLERDKIESLVMNWTVVHPIDEKSPLFGYTAEDMKKADVELYVLVRGFDEVFATVVQQRTSYTYNEILHNRKFSAMYKESEDGRTTILQLQKLNNHFEVKA